jgi:DNA-binding LytR/AlgR family response regulator
MAIVKRLQPFGPAQAATAAGATIPFYIRDQQGLHRVERADILFVQAAGNYAELHTRQRRFVLRTSMRDLLEQLKDLGLHQVNRHTAIHLLHLEHVAHEAVVLSGHTIPLSRIYRTALLERLQVLG